MPSNSRGVQETAAGPMQCVGHVQYLSLANNNAVSPWTTSGNNGNSAQNFTPQPTVAYISTEAQGIRFMDDGTAPTSALGVLIPTGIVFKYDGDISKLQIIANANGANVNINYYA